MSAVPELLLGWVKRLRGVKGELAVATRSQDLTPYLALREARFVRGDAPPELRTLESVRTHGSRLLIRLEGVDSAAAAVLAGSRNVGGHGRSTGARTGSLLCLPASGNGGRVPGR